MEKYSDDQIRLSCQISRYVSQRRQTEENIFNAVADARAAEMSWARIALALGTSTQAAWERYGLTWEQRQQLSRQKEMRFQQPALDEQLGSLSELPDRNKPAKRKRRQGQTKAT